MARATPKVAAMAKPTAVATVAKAASAATMGKAARGEGQSAVLVVTATAVATAVVVMATAGTVVMGAWKAALPRIVHSHTCSTTLPCHPVPHLHSPCFGLGTLI